MNLDTRRLVDMLPRNKGASLKNAGYITPPLHSPMSPSKSSSSRRICAVALLILMLLYLCGFTVPGYERGNKKVVIILAANIGGGDVPVTIAFNIVGVLNVKDPEDWAIEKWSIRNKKDYAARHGMSIPFVANLTRI